MSTTLLRLNEFHFFNTIFLLTFFDSTLCKKIRSRVKKSTTFYFFLLIRVRCLIYPRYFWNSRKQIQGCWAPNRRRKRYWGLPFEDVVAILSMQDNQNKCWRTPRDRSGFVIAHLAPTLNFTELFWTCFKVVLSSWLDIGQWPRT